MAWISMIREGPSVVSWEFAEVLFWFLILLVGCLLEGTGWCSFVNWVIVGLVEHSTALSVVWIMVLKFLLESAVCGWVVIRM